MGVIAGGAQEIVGKIVPRFGSIKGKASVGSADVALIHLKVTEFAAELESMFAENL